MHALPRAAEASRRARQRTRWSRLPRRGRWHAGRRDRPAVGRAWHGGGTRWHESRREEHTGTRRWHSGRRGGSGPRCFGARSEREDAKLAGRWQREREAGARYDGAGRRFAGAGARFEGAERRFAGAAAWYDGAGAGPGGAGRGREGRAARCGGLWRAPEPPTVRSLSGHVRPDTCSRGRAREKDPEMPRNRDGAGLAQRPNGTSGCFPRGTQRWM